MYKHRLSLFRFISVNFNNSIKCKSKLSFKNINVNRYKFKPYCGFSSKTFNITTIRQISQESGHKIYRQVDNNSDINSYTYRTHTCGELRPQDVGKKVVLCGWVQYLRMSKFLLLRDSYGTVQCIVDKVETDISDIPLESILKVEGTVILRPKDTINNDMDTGSIEVAIDNLQILNIADNIPFNLRNHQKPKEQLRLQHRYIDLRFPEMQSNLRQRSLLIHNMRKFLVEKKGFVEVETPTLFCQTPGGAREFVVPTHHSSLFYSLVQSPQQFKQMLMAGGIDRYFQFARCYRDESTRPDRQPEFTQLDVELSFSNLDNILTMIEELLYGCYLKPIVKPPFKRMTYDTAIELYGSDKPNINYDLKLENVREFFTQKALDDTFSAYALPYPKEVGKLTAKYKKFISDLLKKYKHVKIVSNEYLLKELGSEIAANIEQKFGQSTSVIVAIGNKFETCTCLGDIRNMLLPLLVSKNLVQKNEHNAQPLWIIDFPLFVKGEDGVLETCHHPFTAPHPDDIHLLHDQPESVRSLAYDLVLDGNEIGGGSVRTHNAALQEKLLSILKIDSSKLSHFLNALKSGCPPHAGIALGIDRLISLMCSTESIRDVIAFPKSHQGKDPLSGAPNVISDVDKKYYHIKTV